MNRFGFFDELSEDDAVALLKQLASEGPLSNEQQVLSYLDQATQVMLICGIVTDLLSDGDEVIGASHVSTDGVWCWTSDVCHYIKKYHVVVPQGFLEHMQNNNWQCPPVSNPKSIVEQIWPS